MIRIILAYLRNYRKKGWNISLNLLEINIIMVQGQMLPKVKVKVPLYKVKRTYFKEIDG